MNEFLLALRLLLAAVLAFSAIGKFLDRDGTTESSKNFVSEDSARLLSIVLPIAEICLAIALLPVVTMPAAALASAGLLFVFTLVILRAISQQNEIKCNCFGQISNEPIGVLTGVRNSVLLLIAFLVSFSNFGGEAISIFPNGYWSGISIALVMLFAIVFVIIHLLFGLIRTNERIEAELKRLEAGADSITKEGVSAPESALLVGAMLPDVVLNKADGSGINSRESIDESFPTLILIVSANCNPCAGLIPEINNWISIPSFKTIVISKGERAASLDKFSQIPEHNFLTDESGKLATEANAVWTPAAFVVRTDARLASKPAFGDQKIRELVDTLSSAKQHSLEIGGIDSLVGKPFPDLDGVNRESQSAHLYISWSTSCSFCDEFIEELTGYKESKHSANILLVSQESADKVKSHAPGFDAVEVKQTEIIESFGLNGTPSAILVNAEGLVISEPAVGAKQIRSLF